MTKKPWEMDGPETTRKAVDSALDALHTAKKRKPDEGDVPKPSTFPMTPAAREALRLGRKLR